MEFLKHFSAYYVGTYFWTTTLLVGFCATFVYRRSSGWPIATLRAGMALMLVGSLAKWSVRNYFGGQLTSDVITSKEYFEAIGSYGAIVSLLSEAGIIAFVIGALSCSAVENRSTSLAGALFDPRGALTRREFVSIVLPIVLSNLLASFFIPISMSQEASTLGMLWRIVPGAVLFSYILFACYIKRFRDLGHSGLMALTMLVPVVNILALLYLLFARGDSRNEYASA